MLSGMSKSVGETKATALTFGRPSYACTCTSVGLQARKQGTYVVHACHHDAIDNVCNGASMCLPGFR